MKQTQSAVHGFCNETLFARTIGLLLLLQIWSVFKNTQEGPLAENVWSPLNLEGNVRYLRSVFLAANSGGCCSDSRSESVNT